MFAYIQGKLAEKNPAYAVIEANGVGYLLHISLNTYILLPEDGPCKLFTHHVVREDAQLLYGFAGEEERDLFRLLISVSGVGPNTARMLLSSLKVSDLKDAITGGKVGVLKSIKGIGEKSAQRIIVDLKDKVEKSDASVPEKVEEIHNTVRQEALSGLVTLGFPRRNAEKALDQVVGSEMQARKVGAAEHDITVEFLIREALKVL